MNVLKVLNSPWAITEDKLREIVAIYQRHALGGKLTPDQLAEAIGPGGGENRPRPYGVVDGVAVVSIDGPMAKKMSMFSDVSGGCSTQKVQANFLQAMADPGVHCVVLLIDSPGGTVDGTQALADTVRNARGKGKPIYAVADGMMASAAYWVGSAADKIYLVGPTTEIGSIGVVSTHVDTSKAEEMEGIKVTEITAGKYKRVASQHAPLTDEGRASIQAMVDDIYTIFVDDVAKNRQVTSDQVLKMADGKIYMGQKAIDAGLADGYSTLAELIASVGRPTGGDATGANASGDGAAGDEGGEGRPADAAGSVSPPSESTAEAAKTSEDPPAGDPTPTAQPATSGDGGTSMADPKVYSETQLRQLFGVADGDSLEAVIDAFSQAREAIASGVRPDMVSYMEYARLEQKLTAAEHRALDIQRALDVEKGGRKQDALKREAELACEKGIKQGRLTKKQVDAWALKQAMEDPRKFELEVLPSMPRLFSTEHNGDDDHGGNGGNGKGGEDEVRLDATAAFRQRVNDKIAAAKASGVTLPRITAMNAVAEEEPEIYRAYQKESRENGREDD